MTAIIKNRFRLQNAKDFLENFKNHPRMRNGVAAPILNDITVTNVDEVEKTATANLNYTWTLDSRVTDFNNSNNNTQVRADAIRGLIESSGAHIKDRNHYLFIGKSLPWGTTTVAENTPPTAADTLLEEKEVWHEMLSLKKISEMDATLVIPRVDWDLSKNTVYVPFDDKDSNLYKHPTPAEAAAAQAGAYYASTFYCLNDEFDLFICLENGGGARSVEKPIKPPTATTLVDYRDLDGYLWKYVTTIKPSDASKFLTDSWIPVKTLGNVPNNGTFQWAVEQNAVAGEALSFIVENGGSNYTKTHTGQITSVAASGSNTLVSLSAIQNGVAPSDEAEYYTGGQLYVTDGAGVGTSYTIIEYNTASGAREAKLSGAAPVDTTSVYTIGPRLVIESDSETPILARPVITNGAISKIRVSSRGLNATFVHATVAANSAQTSGGIRARVRAVLGPIGGLGKDPEKDLGAFFVMMSAKLAHAEGAGDFPIDNDYRQIGIIRDVKNVDGTLATANTLIATKMLVLTGVAAGPDSAMFRPDEIFSISTDGGNAWTEAGRVLEYAENPNQLGSGYMTYFKTLGTISPELVANGTVLVRGADSRAQGTISSATDQEVKKFDGEILYLENRRPILRAPDQIEDIKAIVEF